MKLDEMIIKANVDGKTYLCNGTDFEYSKEKGFVEYVDFLPNGISDLKRIATVFINGWEEKPKRHLTVSEAEKELDCVIDTPDISKLFRSSDVLPEDGLKIIVFGVKRRTCYFGYYDSADKAWKLESGEPITQPKFYMKPDQLTRLLPKE